MHGKVKGNLAKNETHYIDENLQENYYVFDVMSKMHNPLTKEYPEVRKHLTIGERTYDKALTDSSKMNKRNTKGMPYSYFDGYDSVEMIHDPKKYREDKTKSKKESK